MPYFPFISSLNLSEEKKFRDRLIDKSHLSQCVKYSIYSFYNSEKLSSIFIPLKKTVLAVNRNAILQFPKPIPIIKLHHFSNDYHKWLYRKYTYPDFCIIESGDVVVDCGSYVGGFARSVVDASSHVYCFEPEHTNFSCLKTNTRSNAKISVIEAGLFNESKEIEFNISENSVEHSILKPDDESVLRTVSITVYRLDEYATQNKITTIDFLKVEAEGVEPEIIEGALSLNIRKLAIDCSPERNGESPLEEISELLKINDYDIRQRNFMLFAVKR